MPQCQSHEGTTNMRIGVRRPLARQIRQKNQTLAARWGLRSLFDQSDKILVRGHHVPIPPQTSSRRQHDPHDVPHSRYRMGKGVQPAVPLGERLLTGREDHTRSAQGQRHHAGLHGPDAHCLGRLVASTSENRRSRRQAGKIGSRPADPAGALGSLVRRREPLTGNLEGIEQLRRPVTGAQIEHEGSARTCAVGGVVARQAITDVVLRQQNLVNLAIDLRLVSPHPQQLRSGEPGEGIVAGDLHQPGQT